MSFLEIAKKLGVSESKQLVNKAAEIRRLADIQFDSSVIGIGEICKAVICLEIAATMMDVVFNRQAAIKLSGMSEKAYNRSFNSMQNGIGIKFKNRFLDKLPSSRKSSTDFTEPIFNAAAFYLCAKKQKLKVDKIKLIELAGTSETEFSSVSTTMMDLCFDVFGTAKEKDSKKIKSNRELLDALPEKRTLEDGGTSSSDDDEPSSAYKKRKKMDKHSYDDWKSQVVKSNKRQRSKAPPKRTKQETLDFLARLPK